MLNAAEGSQASTGLTGQAKLRDLTYTLTISAYLLIPNKKWGDARYYILAKKIF